MTIEQEIRLRCDSVFNINFPTGDPWREAHCKHETFSSYGEDGSVKDAVASARRLGWAITRVTGDDGVSRYRVRCPLHLGRKGIDHPQSQVALHSREHGL